MTRVAHLHPHLSPEELTQRARQAPDTTEARRFQLLRLIADGKTIQDAASLVGLGYSYARRILRRYNEQGPQAMRNRWREQRPPPPRPLLTLEQQEELRQALAGRAPDGGLWNGPKVAQWIQQQTGREQVHPQRGWDYLRRLRHTPHVPRPRSDQADPAAQAAFKQSCATRSPSDRSSDRG
jgi:transposase